MSDAATWRLVGEERWLSMIGVTCAEAAGSVREPLNRPLAVAPASEVQVEAQLRRINAMVPQAFATLERGGVGAAPRAPIRKAIGICEGPVLSASGQRRGGRRSGVLRGAREHPRPRGCRSKAPRRRGVERRESRALLPGSRPHERVYYLSVYYCARSSSTPLHSLCACPRIDLRVSM